MADGLRRFGAMGRAGHARRFHSRERRLSLAGIPDLPRTHLFAGAAAMAVATIDTGAAFPDRSSWVTFATEIEILDNLGVHRGLVFEFGDAAAGCALWIGDETIGFHAGAAGEVDGATALFDHGAELPVGWRLSLVAAVRVGDGKVRLWGDGVELARGEASGGAFDPLEWSSDGAGSFAANESGTVVSDVPAGSAQAPAGFAVVAPLSVYAGVIPRHFV